jgi:DNA-binding transcriptional MocR family regulator
LTLAVVNLITNPQEKTSIVFSEDIMSSSTSDQAYQGIRQMFVRGEFQPGQRVSQSKLARQRACSTVPVVEAMRRLESEGLLVNWPNDFRGEPNDSEVGARDGREAKEDTVAADMIFDNLEDNGGWVRDERTPVARSLSARVLRSALYADNRQVSPAFKAIDFHHDRIAWFVYYAGRRFRTHWGRVP